MIYITIGLDARNIYIDNIISKTDKDIFYFDENSFQDFLNEVNTESLFKIPSLLILKNANKIKNIAKILENLNNDNIKFKNLINGAPSPDYTTISKFMKKCEIEKF